MDDRGFLTRLSLARPRLVLLLMAAVTLVAAAGLPRLGLRTDGQALVPAADPDVLRDAEVRDRFGLRDSVVVWIETKHADGALNVATLALVEELTQKLAALPGVGSEHVMSLATERRPRVHTGTLNFRLLLDPFPDTPQLMRALREDLEAIALLDGVVLSKDWRGTAVLVGVPAITTGDRHAADRAERLEAIRAIAAEAADDDHRIDVVGAPVAEAALGAHILRDLLVLVPVAMAVIALVVWLACRSIWGVGLALTEVGFVLVFTLGAMGWMDRPMTLVTAVLPVILTLVGLVDEIHVLFRTQALLALGEGSAIERAMGELARPIGLTSATTALGFLSFLAAPIESVRDLGLFAALGIGYCWLFTRLAVPAAISLFGEARLAHPGTPPGAAIGGLLARGLARPRQVLIALALVTAVLVLGLPFVHVQDGWIEGFAPESEFRRATERVEAGLLGTHVLSIELAFARSDDEPEYRDRRGPMLDPALLNAIGEFESGLRALPEVGGVLGPYSHLTTVNFLFLAQRPDTRRIPDRPARVANLLYRFDQVRGELRRRRVIDDDLAHGHVSVFLRAANYRDTARVMDAAEALAGEHLGDYGATLGFAGDVGVSQAMIRAIVRTQALSLSLALIGAFGVVWWATRSRRTAALATLPTAVAVLWLLGAMGWMGVPIGVATSTFCAIAFGIGVDYAVHLLERVRIAEGEMPEAGTEAHLRRALDEASPAIAADAAAVAAGFGVLLLSQVPASARLGGVVALALLAAAVLALLGLPAVLRLVDLSSGGASESQQRP